MLYFCDTCKHMIRTLPQLRYDPVNPEDVDTRQEDHLYDAMKYFLMSDPIAPRESMVLPKREYHPLEEDLEYGRFAF